MLAYLSLIQQLLSLGGGSSRRSQISGINLNLASISMAVFGIAAAFGAIIFTMIALQGWLAMIINSEYAGPLAWLCCAGLTLAVAGISLAMAKDAKRDGLISLAYAPAKVDRQKYGAHANGARAHGAQTVNGAATEHKSPFDETFIKNMADEFSNHIEDHPIAAVIIAGLAGMAAGKSISE